MPTMWQHWLKGLIAAFVSAAANSLTTMLVDPERFNLNSIGGLEHVGVLALVSGAGGAALYLRQSPIPGVAEDTPPKP